MRQPTTDDLTRRLDRVERELRWWRVAALAGVLLLVTVGAAPKSTTVETERLVVRDPSGKVRAVLGIEAPQRGWPQPPDALKHMPKPEFGLFIYNDGGAETVRVTDWGGAGALVVLTDSDQNASASLRALRGIGDVEVTSHDKGLASRLDELNAMIARAAREKWDEARQKRELARLSQERSVSLSAKRALKSVGLYGRGEYGTISLVSGLGGSSLSLSDPDRKSGVDMLLSELSFRDDRSSRRAAFQLGDDGVPSLSLFDQAGKARAVLGRTTLETIRTGEATERAESSLVLFDKDGKVIWKAP